MLLFSVDPGLEVVYSFLVKVEDWTKWRRVRTPRGAPTAVPHRALGRRVAR